MATESSTNMLEEQYQAAEALRAAGRAEEAITLYHEVLGGLSIECFNRDLHIRASHMLGVAYKMACDPRSAHVVLAQLLSELGQPKDALRRAHVLRDLGDVCRLQYDDDSKKTRLQQAKRHLEEALEIFVRLSASGECDDREVAATLGFMSRAEFSEKNSARAMLLALKAKEIFFAADAAASRAANQAARTAMQFSSDLPDEVITSIGTTTYREHLSEWDRSMEFHHSIWLAQLYVHLGNSEAAVRECRSLLELNALGVGSDVHRARIETIQANVQNAGEMEVALRKIRP